MSILSQILNGTENFWIFAKFHPQVPSGQKSDFWTKFLTWLKISGFCQISSFAGPAWSKISFLSQIFQHLSKFLDFAKFHPLQVQSGQNSQFWAKFSTRLKISGFYQISFFACPEWSKMYVFKPNFQHDSKFLDFIKFHLLQILSGRNS